MAQPCSYIYPIYSVVKHHRHALGAAIHPGVMDETLSKDQNSTIPLTQNSEVLNLIQTMLSRAFGGADRDRTDDILLAKQALSQLSYSPTGLSIPEDGGPG